MEKSVMVGITLILTGTLLLSIGLVSFQREVASRDAVLTDVEDQLLGPHSLPGGSYTIWLEESPAWPDNVWTIRCNLVHEDGEPIGEWVFEVRTREIEGRQCFQVCTVSGLPSGDYFISVTLHGTIVDPPGEARVFILAEPGLSGIALLVSGSVMTIIGVTILAVKWWPKRTG
jgi:hypothetical protein